MIVLAIDTATLTASCAVVRVDGAAIDVLAVEDGPTSAHSEKILPLVARVADSAGIAMTAIDAFAIGAGPGSFTGLRIGMATAKGLAFAADRPLWVVSSLAALGLDLATADGDAGGHAALYVPVLDARRGEVYVGFYRRTGSGLVEAVAAERVVPPSELPALLAAAAAIVGDGGAITAIAGGDALTVHAEAMAALPPWLTLASAGRTTPSAISVARLAIAGDRVDRLTTAGPAYIRPSEAEVKYPDGVPGALRRS
jgi:tRNA threonylcarbamoyladenosine biosynthesis protein TsaB